MAVKPVMVAPPSAIVAEVADELQGLKNLRFLQVERQGRSLYVSASVGSGYAAVLRAKHTSKERKSV